MEAKIPSLIDRNLDHDMQWEQLALRMELCHVWWRITSFVRPGTPEHFDKMLDTHISTNLKSGKPLSISPKRLNETTVMPTTEIFVPLQEYSCNRTSFDGLKAWFWSLV